jgi:diadenosine tetraphosphate (Ap4A) HIT family hydrolase
MDQEKIYGDHITPERTCPFCCLDPERIVAANNHAIAIFDAYPISPAHMLILPRRHIASFFEVTNEERQSIMALLAEMRDKLLLEKGAAGFNIGINEGVAAGQTVMHLHVHLIPRFTDDMSDPRGGIRWIFPDKAVYWDR